LNGENYLKKMALAISGKIGKDKCKKRKIPKGLKMESRGVLRCKLLKKPGYMVPERSSMRVLNKWYI
jgi:hypothetical protein